MMSRDSAILPRKLDWMFTDRMDDLKSIMNDNATFLNVPRIGSLNSLITVYGDNKVNIQRTIRTVMQLVRYFRFAMGNLIIFCLQACQFYVASLWLLPVQFNVLLPPSTLNPSQISTVLKQIADVSGAEVVFKSMCFEMHGLEHEVRSAIQMILDIDAIKVCANLSRSTKNLSLTLFRCFIMRYVSRSNWRMNIASSSAGKRTERSTKSCRRRTSRSSSKHLTSTTF